MEYPLSTPWTVYYDYQDRKTVTSSNWEDSLRNVCTVENVPSFLYALENIETAERWPMNSNIHFFRKNIRPMWEDSSNINGGKWVLELSRDDEYDIADIWNKTMAFCVSESAYGICGCVFSPRRAFNRIALWTSTTDESVLEIGNAWKETVTIPSESVIAFKTHENALKGYWDKKAGDLYRI
ncbi:eukaryotic translation initiation factor 4E [Hamiltosporidium tvaerminnensis]|uniref:Eukaryotic translation initiation factor 4E n=2 Tax=Hamiltosporidium TaxID=1176354 RepID=A0A4Q9M0I0_9MICR|nr:translation initiation factor eIF4E [Hamiltosporidium tvaerminnensis]TBU00426.1 eukaryotic translation initiation factor 4E [Hamiltosporidium tvaerminnensis]TBU09594.1 eukaryotic translation initiation factor 4E [Hamiltosporidium magnivora]TBU18429.1 eukaryotic translation initiation factor 4E [Hamiltosporidium tvaerminnensis]TBU20085.1 eukaryotic translation initiation factor 4E [Hamiltosporidium tvaerminnensis]